MDDVIAGNVVVFSAQAEVFPNKASINDANGCFLRASGGVSMVRLRINRPRLFSPRKRRCFLRKGNFVRMKAVFSAQAEVFPTDLSNVSYAGCFLRASGGVSSAT